MKNLNVLRKGSARLLVSWVVLVSLMAMQIGLMQVRPVGSLIPW